MRREREIQSGLNCIMEHSVIIASEWMSIEPYDLKLLVHVAYCGVTHWVLSARLTAGRIHVLQA